MVKKTEIHVLYETEGRPLLRPASSQLMSALNSCQLSSQVVSVFLEASSRTSAVVASRSYSPAMAAWAGDSARWRGLLHRATRIGTAAVVLTVSDTLLELHALGLRGGEDGVGRPQ